MFDDVDKKKFWLTIINTIQDGLLLVSPNGQILFANKALENMLGYTAEELRGKSCELFGCTTCFPERLEGSKKSCSLFADETGPGSQCIFRKKDGTAISLHRKISIFRDKSGTVIGGIESLTDMSRLTAKDKIIANLQRQLHYREGFNGIIGKSVAMQRVYELAASASKSEAPIIVYGEPGTGKELLAHAIHDQSPRRHEPFLKLNCTALSETLLESELFGHVKDAFNGAESDRTGMFESARGGTLFLDEIADLPLTTQAKLLRVLRQKEIERIGDHTPIPIDVRVIVSTHKNLQRLIGEGQFREDLFYRLGVIPIHIPPLRERKADLPLLLDVFIKRLGQRTGKQLSGVTKEALSLLYDYPWSGNVRELVNVLEYAFVLCHSGDIDLSHLPAHLLSSPSPAAAAKERLVEDNGKQQLLEALKTAGGNQTKAAEILGVSRVTVWKRMKRYGLSKDLEGIAAG